ncbi:MAG: BatA domain-containing protein [Phycisphaerales bacterium]|nr:BatA domain-containing protein [Phycisphaerales bacterium]MCB9835128.1 BatA domain-containing protein [Phycisphaera sp.]
MSLLNPILGALAFAFVALPIILHFLKRKRKPIQWGAMRFLIEAYRRKRRRMTLEQLLLLLTRCALVLLFALVVGRPIFGSSSKRSGPTELYIVLDDSVASAAREGGSEEAFETLKARAVALIDTLSAESGDRAGLILMSSPSRSIIAPASSDLGAVRRAIERAERTDAAADLHGALGALDQSLTADEDDAPAVTLAILSTLRAGSIDPDRPLPRLASEGRDVRLIVSAAGDTPMSNVAISAIEPVRSVVLGEAERDGQALVRLERSGVNVGEAQRVAVTLATTGTSTTSRAVAEFAPGSTTAEVMLGFVLPAAENAGQPVLTATLPDDANRADNAAGLPIDRRGALRVGIIASRPLVGQVGIDRFTPADWVRLALAPGEASGELRLVDTTPSSIDAPRLATLDAAFLLEPDAVAAESWFLLRRFVEHGGLLVVMPPAKDSVQLWTDAMTESLGLDWQIAREPVSTDEPMRINTESRPPSDRLLAMIAGELDQLAAGVSFEKALPVLPTEADDSALLTLSDGSVLLAAKHPMTPSGRTLPGLVVYLASPPNLAWTDLPTRPLMVPLMQELVRQGIGLASDSAVRTAGRTGELPGRATEVLSEDGEPVELPIRRAGQYRLLDDAGEDAGVLAVHADVRGTRTDVVPTAVLEPWLAASVGDATHLSWLDDEGNASLSSLAEQAGMKRAAVNPWIVWLIAAALVLAILETALARWSARSMEQVHGEEAIA